MKHLQKSWPKRLADFDSEEGRIRVRLRRDIRSYWMVLPAGTIGTVRAGSRWDRLDFIADSCAHCGVRMRITTSSRSFELIDAGGNSLP